MNTEEYNERVRLNKEIIARNAQHDKEYAEGRHVEIEEATPRFVTTKVPKGTLKAQFLEEWGRGIDWTADTNQSSDTYMKNTWGKFGYGTVDRA